MRFQRLQDLNTLLVKIHDHGWTVRCGGEERQAGQMVAQIMHGQTEDPVVLPAHLCQLTGEILNLFLQVIPVDPAEVFVLLGGRVTGEQHPLGQRQTATKESHMTPIHPCILLVDDDLTFRNLVETYLTDNGYRVRTAGSALEMRSQTNACDLILLDLSLPDEDGIVLLRRFRRQWTMPVMVVSGRSQDDCRVAALELGADDFLIKPFSPPELLLRIEHCLKRAQPADRMVEWRFAGWRLNVAMRRLLDPAGAVVKLTRGEFELLHALLLADGAVVSRQRLMDLLPTRTDPHPNTLTVLMSRLRRKLDEPDATGESILETVPGVGYRLRIGAGVSQPVVIRHDGVI
jgi:two-component system, OmpR family, response regulator